MNPQIAVLVSGGGTTVEAFIRAGYIEHISTKVGLVIVSRADAGVFDKIAKLNKEYGLNIECVLISNKTHPAKSGEVVNKGFQTTAEETAILEKLKACNFDLVALMGYMKRIGPELIKEFGWKSNYSSIYEASMVNTHPGILPDTKAMYGKQIQQYIIDHNLPYAGQTLHLVSDGYDEGPLIAEHRVNVELGDTADSIFKRVQDTEKLFLPEDIEAFIRAKIAYNKSV